MGLDAHVMPISAFMVNDYDPAMVAMMREMGMESVPAARIGPGSIEQITPARTLWGRFQLHSGLWTLRRKFRRWKASRRRKEGLMYVEWLRGALRILLGMEMDWSEEGGSVLTHQLFLGALHSLRTYALRLEYPDALGRIHSYKNQGGEEVDLVSATYERASELELESERFAHLCEHSDVHGFYIPVAFDPPQSLVDPTRSEAMHEFLRRTPVGSSIRLLAELEELNERLGIQSRWDIRELGLSPSETDDPVLQGVHTGWKLMEGFARTSVERGLPICFDG